MDVHLMIELRVRGDLDGMEEHFDAVADEFMSLDGIDNASMGACIADQTAEFSFTIEAPTEMEAVVSGYGALRAAIHAADGWTPGWEEMIEVTATGVVREGQQVA